MSERHLLRYRSHGTLDPDQDPVEVVEDAVHAWLARIGIAAPTSSAPVVITDDLLITRAETINSMVVSYDVQVRRPEVDPSASIPPQDYPFAQRTTITASQPSASGQAWIDIQSRDLTDDAVVDPSLVRAPTIARDVLDKVALADAQSMIKGGPLLLNQQAILDFGDSRQDLFGLVVKSMSAPMGRAPSLVFGTRGEACDPESWLPQADRMKRLAEPVFGALPIYLLDPVVTRIMRRALSGHADLRRRETRDSGLEIEVIAPPGPLPDGMRMYTPRRLIKSGLFANGLLTVGQKISPLALTSAQLEQMRDEEVTRSIQFQVMQMALSAPLGAAQPILDQVDAEVDSLLRQAFSRERIQAERAVREAHVVASAEEPSALERLRADLERAHAEAARLRRQVEELDVALLEAHRRADDAEEGRFEEEQDRLAAQAQLRAAQLWLIEGGLADEAAAVESQDIVEAARREWPVDFEELTARLDRLPRIVFCAQDRPIQHLAARDPHGELARKAWSGLLALNDYAECRSRGGHCRTLQEHLRSVPPEFHPWSLNRYAAAETEPTLDKYGHERIFPVPTSVSTDGRALMVAHLQLASKGSLSPRLYFLDRTEDGHVVVGYLGAHLRNSLTN